MALPFRRARGGSGEEGAPVCSAASPAQRCWEVQALLCSLSPEVQQALGAWLLGPTDLRRWPPPAKFEHQRLPFAWAHLRDCSQDERARLLREELQVLRQTLDFPPEALSGLTRNGLLTVHGIRLRQLEGWLWPRGAARQIRRMIA